MAIPSRQIGWGTEENLLWQISRQLETLTGVTNAAAGTSGTSGLSGNIYLTTSTTLFTLGTSGTITVGTGLAYSPAQDIIITHDVNHHQVCPVITYDDVTGVLVFDTPSQTVGSGTYSSWIVNLDGAAGGNGSSGTNGTSGSNGSSGISPVLYSGTFFDTTTQNNGGATTANQVLINSTQLANGFTLGPNNRINVTNSATYFISLNLQLAFTGGASNYNVTVWYTLNDQIVDNSAFTFTTTGAQNDQTLAVITDTLAITAGQYLKFYWWSQATGMKLLPTAAGSNPTRPLSPSVNFTIFNIA